MSYLCNSTLVYCHMQCCGSYSSIVSIVCQSESPQLESISLEIVGLKACALASCWDQTNKSIVLYSLE